MPAPDVSVVIPAYNEAGLIADTVTAVAAALHGRGITGEILLADDGSDDGTGDRARSAPLAEGVTLRVLATDRNRGKGDAVRRGMLAAAGRLVIFTDADLSTPLDELDRFLPALERGAPVVIGSRKLDPGRVTRPQPWPRQFMGRVFSWLSRRLLHPRVSDFTCGFKGFRCEVVATLFEPLTITGWAFDAELLHVARRRGVPVLELPVAWANRRETRVRLGRDVLRSAWELAVVLVNGWRGCYRPPPST